jgi:DNA polymerase-3 subunit epsilon
MFPESIVVLDFETSGLYCDQGDRIIEVAALRVVDRCVAERFETLVRSPVHLPRSIAKFTGISTDMIDQAPAAEQVIPDLLDFLGDDLVVAHNAAFDQAFLENECSRFQLHWPHADFFCTVKLARLLFPEMQTHALGALACSLGLEFTPGAHRAGADAQATVGVLLRLMDILYARYSINDISMRQLQPVLQLPVPQALAMLNISVNQSATRAA